MRKAKNILVILLSLVLLAAGSMLPMAAARIQDKTTTNMVQYEDIEALQLKLEETVQSLSFQEKISLLVNGNGTEVTDEVMRMNSGEVVEAAVTALQPYADIYGLPLDNDRMEIFPYMVFGEKDPPVQNYYWQINMSLKISQNDTITVILDDETGKLIAVEWIDLDMQLASAYLPKMQNAISSVYLGELGLNPVAEWQMETESAYYGTGEDIEPILIHYQFENAVFGETNVEMGVHSNGFYILPR